MTALAFYLAIRTLEYFSFETDLNFLKVRQELIQQTPWKIAFYIHITGGLTALAVGALQFWPWMRRKHLKIHRALGILYTFAILLAGPTGLYMAFFARGGFSAQVGFTALAIVWMGTTWKGVEAILLKKAIKPHGEWITRSYAVTFAAVTLRLWTPILSIGFGLPEATVLSLVPWLSWVLNLAFVEAVFFLKDIDNSNASSVH